jgi:hypothetical protein
MLVAFAQLNRQPIIRYSLYHIGINIAERQH